MICLCNACKVLIEREFEWIIAFNWDFWELERLNSIESFYPPGGFGIE